MDNLQRRWHECLAAALLLPHDSFRLLQPAALITSAEVAARIEASVPGGAAITFAPEVHSTRTFFDVYEEIASRIDHGTSSLEEAIGPDVDRQWRAYLATRGATAPGALPEIFRDWAMIYAPDAAVSGSVALAASPAADARKLPMPPGPSSSTSLSAIEAALDQSPRASVQMTTSPVAEVVAISPFRIAGTRKPPAEDLSEYGVWRGSNQRGVRERFAASALSVEVRFDRVAAWTVTRGDWYDSSVLHRAVTSRSAPYWEHYFGEEGVLRHVVSSFVVARGLHAIVSSAAPFAQFDQQTIEAHAHSGLWPFYLGDSDGVSNTVRFDDAHRLRIEISARTAPIAIGANVLEISRYAGSDPS